ncbi:hypothetical protein NO1_0285 [Candidatus Termititenax aidoneus]|uniref:Uncharacterized protein n=1 Tax=Termititenax aidoneus TaxID=2218524 RepID=A0A388TAT6_TERA1|nr:hypothetical protein NO1_0285 [Candidatus Termititenax aidoneus]
MAGHHLTIKNEAFCRKVALEIKAPYQAYKEVYNPKNSTDKSIREMASKLYHKPHIQLAIKGLQEIDREYLKYDKEKFLRDMDGFIKENKGGNKAVVLRAYELKGKAAGVFANENPVFNNNILNSNTAIINKFAERENQI